ncbi:MAG: hypothetical protein R3330_13225 [Saprospiraceae bacterium]|nr:hypothetical protein [Saprospiraceae bacterium]
MLTPTISVEEDWHNMMVRHFMQEGMNIGAAERKVEAMHQRIFNQAMRRRILEATWRWAQTYMELHPHRLKRVGSFKRMPLYRLEGFKPEQMQAYFVPWQITGRPGFFEMRKALQEMGADDGDDSRE